jgi:hypothetical protein
MFTSKLESREDEENVSYIPDTGTHFMVLDG